MNATTDGPEPAAEPGSDVAPELPRWAPSPAEYDDLALALEGVLPDLAVLAPADVPDGVAAVELTDQEGTPVARLEVVERHRAASGRRTLSGPVTPLAPREDGVFPHLHLTPAQVRARFAGELERASAPAKVAAVLVDAPLDSAALDLLATELAPYDAAVLLPLVGAGSPRVVSAYPLVRATTAAARLLPGEPLVVPVPLARRDEPAEDAARRERVARAYGHPVEVAAPSTDARYPDTIGAIVSAEHPPAHEQGLVVFFTGLSGSGKSTVARRLHDVLLERGDRTVTLLDGDVVRRLLSAGLGFSKADREANITRIGFVAAEVARHGGLAICAPIAPYAATRAEVRRLVGAAGGEFVLVHVATPLAECERRDRKGLYARARAGLITEFTGISDPYEEPTDADLALDTTDLSVDEAVSRVVDLLGDRGWLAEGSLR